MRIGTPIKPSLRDSEKRERAFQALRERSPGKPGSLRDKRFYFSERTQWSLNAVVS